MHTMMYSCAHCGSACCPKAASFVIAVHGMAYACPPAAHQMTPGIRAQLKPHLRSARMCAEAAAAAAEAAEAAGDGPAEQDDTAAPAAAVDPGLPRGVVKKIMLLDPEVQRVSADAVWLVGEATRLFLHALAAKGATAVTAKKRKTIMLQDFDTLVRWVGGAAGVGFGGGGGGVHQGCGAGAIGRERQAGW